MCPPVGCIWLTRIVSYTHAEFTSICEDMKTFLQVYQALTGHTYGETRRPRNRVQTYLDACIPHVELHPLILAYFSDPPKQTKKKES
jgi:hypothetical protein